jgi:hypothetical protein
MAQGVEAQALRQVPAYVAHLLPPADRERDPGAVREGEVHAVAVASRMRLAAQGEHMARKLPEELGGLALRRQWRAGQQHSGR